MKILFVTSRLPYPPFRGDKLKIFNLIRQLSTRHEIHLLSFIQRQDEESSARELHRYCRSIRLIHLPAVVSLWKCCTAIPGRTPFQVAYFSSARMARAVRDTVASVKPDIVHTHLIRMAQYTEALRGPKRVLDMTDAVSLYLRRFRDADRNTLRRLFLSVELRRMLRYEAVTRRFDRSLVCSALDRATLLDHVPDARIDIMENGIDLEQFAPPAAGERPEGPRIIFTGNMAYYPNADAAHYFVSTIFPLVKRAVGDAVLYIVGQNPPASVLSLARGDVVVTGFVEDIRSEYLKSAVAVSPVRYGAGTLNKILEPLALGVPVVATSHGSISLDVALGDRLLISDDPVSFADHVICALRNRMNTPESGSAVARSVRERFSWETIGKKLEGIYDQVKPALSSGV